MTRSDRFQTLQDMFKRYRRPGDLVFAILFFGFSLWLLSHLDDQAQWTKRTRLFAQPAFWPTVSIAMMTLFAGLHLISSVVSPKIPGRWAEVGFWLRSFEYAMWFMGYVLLVPRVGYLPGTLIFTLALTCRVGYATPRMLGISALGAVGTVVLFKALLQVKVPGGVIYEWLPNGLRAFMLTYF